MADEHDIVQQNEKGEAIASPEPVDFPDELANMSDEDLDNMTDEEMFATLDQHIPTDDDEEDDTNEEEEVQEEERETEVEDTEEEESDDEEFEEDDSYEEEDTEKEDLDLDEDDEEDSEEKDSDEELDNTAKALFAPFKANGREISVSSVEDARKLMQMGANYNKKMQNLKPHIKKVRVLEDHDIDADTLNLLIDINKGNKDAIAQLISKHSIDPMELDSGDELNKDYTPEDYSLSDNEFELKEISEELQSTPTYSKTVSVIKNDLDEVSRKFFLDNPNEIKLLNEHIASGHYDKVMGIVEGQKLLGNLGTLSDVEAYVQVSQALLAKDVSGQSEKKPATNHEVSKEDNQRKATKAKKKRVASSPKRKKSATNSDSKLGDVDPLALSDEEFDKLFNEHFG